MIHSLVFVSVTPRNVSLNLSARQPGAIQLGLPAVQTGPEVVSQLRQSSAAALQQTRLSDEQRGHGIGSLHSGGLPTDGALTRAEDPIFSPNQVEIRPQISQLEFPEFPAVVPAGEDVFQIRIVIGPDGTPELIESLQPNTPPPELMALAQRAVRAAEFSPAYIANWPVRSWVTLELQLSTN